MNAGRYALERGVILWTDADGPMTFHRLVYFSRTRPSALGAMDEALPRILKVAQERNGAAAVTGALLACGQWFLQALEGSKLSVLETYARILKDPRHQEQKVITEATSTERLFAGWSMCGLQLSPTDSQIVQTLESSAVFNPAKLTAAGATKLLVTITQIQSKR